MPLGEVIFSEPHRCVSEGRHGLQPAAVAPDRHNPGSSGESGSLEGDSTGSPGCSEYQDHVFRPRLGLPSDREPAGGACSTEGGRHQGICSRREIDDQRPCRCCEAFSSGSEMSSSAGAFVTSATTAAFIDREGWRR